MPSLLEQIGWARENYQAAQPSGGVSYYSPTQQLRPPGTLANSGTAGRIMGGPGPQPSVPQGFQGAGPQLGQMQLQAPQMDLGRPGAPPVAPTGRTTPAGGGSLLDQMIAQMTQQRAMAPPEPTGFMGTLGTMANSLPGQMILKPLEALALPGKAIVAGIGEVAEQISAGPDADEMSWSGWLDKMKDPAFGFGSIAPKTGNVWVDRAIGFTGDVVFDPTSYVVGSAAMAGMSRSSRTLAAARAVAEGFGDDVAEKIGRYGYSVLDNATRARLRGAGHAIEDAGWRFKLPGQKEGVRIPGTEHLERMTSGVSARLRAGTYKIPGMTRLRAWRTPEGLEAAYEKILTGRGAHTLAEASEVINFHEWHKIAANTAQGRMKAMAQNLVKGKSPEDLKEMMRRAELGEDNEVKAFFAEVEKIGQEYGLYFHGRKNYVPHYLTREAVEWLRGETPHARAFRTELSLGDKIDQISPALMERKLVGRTEPYSIMDKKLNVPNGTIDEWNSEFAAMFPDANFKFMNDDPDSILATYMLHMPDDIGTVNAVKRLVESKSGLIRGYHDEDALREVVNDVVTNRMNAAEGKKIKNQMKLAQDVVARLKEDTFRGVHGIQGLLGIQLRGVVDELTEVSDATKLHLGRMLLEEEELAQQVGVRGVGQIPDVDPTVPPPSHTVPDAYGQDINGNWMSDAAWANVDEDIVEGWVRHPDGSVGRGRIPRSQFEAQYAGTRAANHPGGKLERAFNDAAREVEAKIEVIDQDLDKLGRRLIHEQQLYNEGEALTRGRRMSDPEEMAKLRERWNDMVQAKAAAEMDRQAIYAVEDRLKQKRRKQEMILSAYDNPSMLSLMAGEKVYKPTPPAPGEVRTPSGDYRVVGYERGYRDVTEYDPEGDAGELRLFQEGYHEIGTAPEERKILDPGETMGRSRRVRTHQEIRRDYQRRRQAVMPDTPEIRSLGVEIEGQEDVVARTERDLATATQRYGPLINEAKANLHSVQKEIETLKARRSGMAGPGMARARQDVDRQIRAIQDGRLRDAQGSYDLVSQPVVDAEKRLKSDLSDLRALHRRQEEAALGTPVAAVKAPDAPEPTPLPHSPQKLTAARRQKTEATRAIEAWDRRSGGRVRQLRNEVKQIVRKWKTDKDRFDSLTSGGPLASFKLNGNGDIVPNIDSMDQKLIAYVAQRDGIRETYEQAVEQVDILTDRLDQGDDVADELFVATRHRDESKAQLDHFNAEIIRNNLDRWTGTGMERRLRDALELQEQLSRHLDAIEHRKTQIREQTREIWPQIKRRDEADKILQEQADVIKRNAEIANRPAPVPPTVKMRQRLASLNRDETEVLRRADKYVEGFKPILEEVGHVTTPTPVRAVPLADQFYVEQAYAQMMGGGTLRAPGITIQQDKALREAYKMIRDREFYEIAEANPNPLAIRMAKAVIQTIEATRTPGWTRAALATNDTLADSVAEIQRIRQARMVYSGDMSDAQKNAIETMGGTRQVGGSQNLPDRAEHAEGVGIAARALADGLRSSGAMNENHLDQLDDLLEELSYNKRLYSGDFGDETNPLINPYQIDPQTGQKRVVNPIDPHTGEPTAPAPDWSTANRLEQNIADIHRIGDFIYRYNGFIEAGGTPRPEMASYILVQGLRDEVDVLDDQILSLQKKLDGGLRKRWVDYETKQAEHQAKADQYMAEAAELDRIAAENNIPVNKKAKQKLQTKAAEQRRLMREMVEPDDGLLDQEIFATMEFVHGQVQLVDDAVSYLRDARNLRRNIAHPRKERIRLEETAPELAAILQNTRDSVARRRAAIQRAEAAGKNTVTYEEVLYPKRIHLTLEQAEEMMGTYTKAVRDQLMPAIKAAREGGRNMVHIPTFKRKRVTIDIDDARRELTQAERSIGSLEETLGAVDLQLSVLNGKAAIERDELARKVTMMKHPPDPERLEIMRRRLRRMQQRNPNTMSPRDKKVMDTLEDDIDFIENPPSAEEFLAVQQRHDLLDDAIKGFEDATGKDHAAMQAAIDGGQDFFTKLIRGERTPTHKDIQLMKDLLGGEAGDVANQYIQNVNRILSRYGENMTHADIEEVTRAIEQALGSDSLSSHLREQILGASDEGNEFLSETYRARMIDAMVAAAKVAMSDEQRRFAEMFDRMGFQVFSGRTKGDIEAEINALVGSFAGEPTQAEMNKLRMLQKELKAPGVGHTRKQMMQAVGYTMSRRDVDMHRMRQFIIQQFRAQGFDPIASVKDKLLNLRLRRQRVRTMIRGLGGWTKEGKFKYGDEKFYRGQFGEAFEGQVPEEVGEVIPELPPGQLPDIEETIKEAVEVSKQLEAVDPVETSPAPATSGRTHEEIDAEYEAVFTDPSIPIPEKKARLAELRAEKENPQPSAAVEPPEIGAAMAAGGPPGHRPIEEIEEELADVIAQMDAGPTNITDLMSRHTALVDELSAATEAAGPTPPSPEAPVPIEEAAPPAAAPPAGPKRKYKNITTGGWESDDGYKIVPTREAKGGYTVLDPNGQSIGDFPGPKKAKAAIEEHGGAAAPPAAAAPPPEAAVPPAAAVPEEPPVTDEMLAQKMANNELTINEAAAASDALKKGEALPPELEARIRGAIEAEPPPPAQVVNIRKAIDPLDQDELDIINERIEELSGQQTQMEQMGATLPEQDQAELEFLYRERGHLVTPRGQTDPVLAQYPGGTESTEFLQHAANRNMSPKAYEEFLRHQARRQGKPREVIYNWESVLFKGGPNHDMARNLRKTSGEFDVRARGMTGARVRPAGNFTKGILPGQAREAARYPAAILRQQQRLAEMAGRTEMEIDELLSEKVRLASSAEQKELAGSRQGEAGLAYQAQVEHMQAADVAAEGQRIFDLQQQEINRLQVERGKLGFERYQMEQTFTKELQDADISLGNVRSAIAAAHHDSAHLDNTINTIRRALDTTPQKTQDILPIIEDLKVVNAMRRGFEGKPVPTDPFIGPPPPGGPPKTPWTRSPDENDILAVEAMLGTAAEDAMKLNIAAANEGVLAMRMKNFKDGALVVEPTMKRVAVDGWTPIAARLLTDEDSVYVTESLSRALHNASVSWKDENFWAQVEKYTAFFKTYATATPGFHVRNALSSLMMNAVAGVRMKHVAHAPALWRQFKQDPVAFWKGADENTRTAFAMVFGSGAGGQFLERGLGPETDIGGRLYRHAMNNALTRWNKRMGEWVEGPTRLAMALDSVDRGQGLLQGTQRITHYHFNYNEVSRFDRAAKRLIPFWTFMSRNMPLQIIEMWTHPRTYLKYQHFVRNFGEAADPLTPEYWLQQGAFTMDENAQKKDSPWYLAPDLPHLRVAEPFEAAARGDWGKALLSDINPAIAAPLEAYGVHQKFYTGAPIEGYSEPEGAMKMFTPLLQLLGQTEKGGTTGETLTSESAQHMLRTLFPTVGLAERLTSSGGVRAGRQGETLLRAMGAPVYKLTPELRQQTVKSQYAQKRDKYESQVDLARQ